MTQVNTASFFRFLGKGKARKPVVLLASHEPVHPSKPMPSGLNQAIGALTLGLKKIGVDAAMMAPFCKGVYHDADGEGTTMEIADVSGDVHQINLLKTEDKNGVPLILVEKNGDEKYFAFPAYKSNPLTAEWININATRWFDAEGELPAYSPYASMDMTSRSLLFNLVLKKTAQAFAENAAPYEEVIFHGHDHLTALATILADEQVKTAFTIHNPAYRTRALRSLLGALGVDGLERSDNSGVSGGNKVDVMEIALQKSGWVTTVSPQYAQEIGGWGFEEGGVKDGPVLWARRNSFCGILNGLLPQFLAPVGAREKDPNSLTARFLFGGRLAEQKGYDLLLSSYAAFALAGKGIPMAIDVIADGDPEIAEGLKMMAAELRDTGPKVELQAYAESTLLNYFKNFGVVGIMPSRFEPCGLFGMTTQAQNGLLLAHPVGGLVDILGRKGGDNAIKQALEDSGVGVYEYGLGFRPYNEKGIALPLAFARALMGVARASKKNPDIFASIIDAAQKRAQDYYTPERVATEYMEKVYEPLLK